MVGTTIAVAAGVFLGLLAWHKREYVGAGVLITLGLAAAAIFLVCTGLAAYFSYRRWILREPQDLAPILMNAIPLGLLAIAGWVMEFRDDPNRKKKPGARI